MIDYQLPELNRENNNKRTYIFVSVGGNDILQQIVYRDASKVEPNALDNIISNYEDCIKQLIRKMKKAYIILFTLYYPHSSYFRNYDSYIKEWNIQVKKIAKKYNCRILDLSKFMKDSEDFSYSIEPSDIGGKKIVDNMMNMC